MDVSGPQSIAAIAFLHYSARKRAKTYKPQEDTSVGAAQPAAPLTLARSVRLLEQGQVTAAEGLVFATHQQRGFELESDMLEAKASFMTAQASVHSRPVLDFERSQCYA